MRASVRSFIYSFIQPTRVRHEAKCEEDAAVTDSKSSPSQSLRSNGGHWEQKGKQLHTICLENGNSRAGTRMENNGGEAMAGQGRPL